MQIRGSLVAAVLTAMLAAACGSGSGTVAQDGAPQPLLATSSPPAKASSAAPVATRSTRPPKARAATTTPASHPATTTAATRTTATPAPKTTPKPKPKPTSAAPKGCAVSGQTASLAMVNQAGFTWQFSPREVDVHCGTKVTVINKSSTDHTWTGNTWDSGNVASGASYSYVFRFAGSYSFVCTYHPNMTGKVVVS